MCRASITSSLSVLTRRQLLTLGAGAIAARGGPIQYRQYARCLPEYLTGLAREAYKRRNAALAQLTTPAAITGRQDWIRQTFWQLTGGIPERTPLELRTTAAFERNGYRVEKILYQSRPGFHITANLYIPAVGQPPYAGVLFHMGHSLNGKAAETYQKCCQGLARLGYVVLAFDPMGQGERTYYPKGGSVVTRLGSADEEHTVPGRQMLLVGDTATRLQVWDAIRSLDVLAAHPSVDPKRLASTGQSGGATVTMLLAAVDDRLAAVAVSSGNTENFACADFDPPGSVDDAEQNLVGGASLGFDRWDLLYPLAPKPLLIMASARDFFGTYSPRYLSSGREEFGKLARVYAILGAREKLQWVETPTPHALSYFLRTRIYGWFERWLHGKAAGEVAEPPVSPERDETLWVGSTGNTVRDFASKTPLALVRERAAGLRPQRINARELERLLGLEAPSRAALVELARVPSEGAEIAAVEVATAPSVAAPAWLFLPKRPDASRPVLLIVDQRGRNAHWAEGGLYHQLAASGIPVCAADVRGIGDLAPEAGRGNPHYTIPHASEEDYAWASLMLGKPLLGQRVADLLALVRALEPMNRRIVMAAAGPLAVPGLFAAALEPRIDRVYLHGGLVSYRSILDFDDYRHTTANFLPRILESTDLPEIAAISAPRRMILAGIVDGAGSRLDAAAVRHAYKGAPNVEIRQEGTWDLETLSAL